METMPDTPVATLASIKKTRFGNMLLVLDTEPPFDTKRQVLFTRACQHHDMPLARNRHEGRFSASRSGRSACPAEPPWWLSGPNDRICGHRGARGPAAGRRDRPAGRAISRRVIASRARIGRMRLLPSPVFRTGFQMCPKPLGREDDDLFEGARFFEEMRGALDDPQFGRAAQLASGLLVEFDDNLVAPPDDEQRRCADFGQGLAGKVGPPASGNDRPDGVRHRRRPGQRRRRARAGSEEPDRKIREIARLARPSDGRGDPGCEQGYVEDVPAVARLLLGQKIEEKRGEAVAFECLRDRGVPRTEAAAPAAVREDHEPPGICRSPENPREKEALPCGYGDGLLVD